MGRAARALRGFLVHDERVDLDHLQPNTGAATTSSYSQADPHPGEPIPGDTRSHLVVRASNAQDADLDVRVLVPGQPGRDQLGVSYRETGEAVASWRGWVEPNMVQGYRPVQVSATEDWNEVDACTIPSTQQVVAIAADTDGTAPQQVSTWTWDPATRTWGSRVEIDPDNNRTTCAIVCLTGSERLLAFQCAPVAGTVRVDYSDDAGATWTEYSTAIGGPGVAVQELDAAVDTIRVVEDRYGELLLLASDASTGDWWLYRSGDAGGSFEEVDSGTAWGSKPSLARLANGQILLTYIERTSDDAKSILLEDAHDTIDGKTGTAINGTNNIQNLACCVDADGIAYAMGRLSSNDAVYLVRSVDDGVSWEVYERNPFGVSSASTPDDHIMGIRALAWTGGELLWLGDTFNASASPSTDGSLLSAWFGGWSNLEQSGDQPIRTHRYSFGSDDSTTGDSSVYIPGDILANYGWTAAGSAETLSNGYHRFNPAAATSSATRTTGFTSGACSQLVELQVASGGSVAADDAIFSVSRHDGANARKVKLRCSTTHVAIRDDIAGTDLIVVPIDMTAVMQFLIAWGTDNDVTVYYKRPASSVWNEAVQQANLTAGLTASTQTVYVVGCAAATTTDFRVGLIAWGQGRLLTNTADDISGADAFTQRLRWGKSIGPTPYPVRDQGGSLVTRLEAVGGPGRYGEVFSLPVVCDHAASLVLPQEAPSPDRRWRSTTNQVQQILAWDLGTDSMLNGGWAIALALLRTNFAQATLQVRAAGAGGWTTIGSYSAILPTTEAVTSRVDFVRSGDVIRPDPAGAKQSKRMIWPNELKGGHVILYGPTRVRRIRGNTGGRWTANGSPVAIFLDGTDESEAASGLAHIVAPNGVLVVTDYATPFRYIRLVIDAGQNTPEDYYELGQVVLGSIFVLGRQWSRGWSWRESPQVDLEEDDYGTVWAEQRRPPRRELTVSWQDGYDLTAMRAGPAPYLSASPASAPLVTDQDVWQQLTGIMQVAKGGELPVVAVLEVPVANETITDRTMFGYGRLTGVVQANNVQGSEGRSEVLRVESVTLVESV